MYRSIEVEQSNNSSKTNQKNKAENIKVNNNSTSESSSVEGKITIKEIEQTDLSSNEDDRLTSEDFIKASSAIDNEAGSPKTVDSALESSNIPQRATKTFENSAASLTNPSDNVTVFQGCPLANSDQLSKLKTNEIVADLNKTTTNIGFEFKESVDINAKMIDTTVTNSKKSLESKACVAINSETINKRDLSETNVGNKEEITNRPIKKKPLSAREILKKSIEIRGKRLEVIAISQNLEEVTSHVNEIEEKFDTKRENIVENIGKENSTDNEISNKTFQTKNGGFNAFQSIEDTDRNVLEVEEIVEKGEIDGNEDTKNSKFLDKSAVEVNGISDESIAGKVNVVEQFFNNSSEEISGEEGLKTTFRTRNCKKNADKFVENVSLRRGRSRKPNICQISDENVIFPPPESVEVLGEIVNSREKDSTTLQTRRLRQRAAQHGSTDLTNFDGNSVVVEENDEKNSSVGKLLRKALQVGRKTDLSQSVQNFDTNVSQVSQSFHFKPAAEFDFTENVHVKQEILEEQLSNCSETSRKSSQTVSRLFRSSTARQIIEDFSEPELEFEDHVDTTEEYVEDLGGKSGKNLEEVLGESSKVKRRRGRPKSNSQDIGNVFKTSGELRNIEDDGNGENLSNIDDLLKDVLQNLSKNAVELSESCAENNGNVVVVKRKAGRRKTLRKNRDKVLESASSTSNIPESCEKFDNNCGVADENRLQPVTKLRKRCTSTENSSKYVESGGVNLKHQTKPLENKIVLLADGPKMTIDPEVEVLNDMMSGNKSKMADNRNCGPQFTARYCTSNLSEDGLRMIIKKETLLNSFENKTSSPEIYEEDTFEYGNVTHKVRYIIRQEKIKQENTRLEDENKTTNEVGDIVANEIINNNELIQTIKEEPIDAQEELLLENEDLQTREYTVDNTDLKEKVEEKSFINQLHKQNVQTIRFRNRRGRGRPYLIARTVNINSYVSRCKRTTFDNKNCTTDKINNHGKYTMEIKSEICENNRFSDGLSDSVGDKRPVNKVRGSIRVRRRSKVSDKFLDGSKDSENLVNNRENCVGVSDSSENCGNSSSTLENYVESVRNSTNDAGNVKNSTVTLSGGSNKVVVRNLASLVGELDSNCSKNVSNSVITSKLSSNRNLVKNLANLVSKLDSIAKRNVGNVEENVSVVDLDANKSLAENSEDFNSNSCNTSDSSNEVIARSSVNSINSVSGTLDSESVENPVETGLNTIPNKDVSNVSGTANSVSNDNVSKGGLSDDINTSTVVKNCRKSLRKRKTIINYNDNYNYNFVKNVEAPDVTQDLDSCNENVVNFAKAVSSTSDSTATNHVIIRNNTKIFSRKPKNKATSNFKSRTISNRINHRFVENDADINKDVKNYAGTDNDIKTDVSIVKNVKNNSNFACTSQLSNNNDVLNHMIELSTPEPNCNDDIEIECTFPVKLEANTIPIDFDTVSNSDDICVNSVSNSVHNRVDTVSNGGRLFDAVSNIDPDTVSNIESDYEEKYSAVLEANRLKISDNTDFMKTVRSFLDDDVSDGGGGRTVRKQRRRPCELPEIPKSLKCEICGRVLKSRQSYEHHMTTHNDPSKQVMECSCCKKLLTGERRLKAHMYNFHTLIKTFSCEICKKIFHSRQNLYKHMVKVHLDPETYTCDICKKSFQKKSYLEQHINMHMGVRKHECNLCGKNYMNRSDLQNHLDAHVGFDRYVCGVCGKRMTSMQTMHIHMKRHTRENMFKCEFCGKEYATKCSLQQHMNLHTGKKYTCNTCGAQFHYRNGYNRHMKTHDGKQQECNVCHKVFQRKCYLKKHMTIHMGTEQYMCVYCGKKFIDKSDYNIHVNRHTHAEKFPCEFCGKVFHNKGYWVNHRKLHTGDTEHVCKYCNRKFMKKSLLDRHVSIHEGTNFLECDVCGAVLSSVASCRRHVRHVHGVVL